ncbi:hypothetical protein, partial [Mycobacterium tuberculosis]
LFRKLQSCLTYPHALLRKAKRCNESRHKHDKKYPLLCSEGFFLGTNRKSLHLHRFLPTGRNSTTAMMGQNSAAG